MRGQVVLSLCVSLALALAAVPAFAAPTAERGAGQGIEAAPAWDWPPGPSVIFDPTTGETLRMPEELRGLPPEEVYAFSEELRAEGDARGADTLFALAGYMGYPFAAERLARLAFGEDWPDEPSRVFYFAHLATERTNMARRAHFWLALAGGHPDIGLAPEQIEIWTLVAAAAMTRSDQELSHLERRLELLRSALGDYSELLAPTQSAARDLRASFDAGPRELLETYAPICEGPDLPGRDVFCADIFLFFHGDDPRAMRLGSFALSNLDLRFEQWFRIGKAQRLLCTLALEGDSEAAYRLGILFPHHQSASGPQSLDVAVLLARAAPRLPASAPLLEDLMADMSARDRRQVAVLAEVDRAPIRC